MNQISVETNVIETETAELQTAQDAIVELNSAQLMLVGGGTAAIILEEMQNCIAVELTRRH
jgi:hypothetical protein